MNEIIMSQSGSFDFRNLSEVELEVIVQVIQKDFEIKAAEKARLRRHRRKLKEADERVSILANSDFNEKFCVICFKRFIVLFFPKRCCLSCRHCMCRNCSVWIPRDKKYLCLLCQNERNLKSMSCDWYYGLLKNRFQHDASELVAQSLYSNQGQYSLVTLDLLQKVKGAQISRYRQKILCKWEEMQEKLRKLDLSEINRVKREEAHRIINDEYKSQFREILKQFSQVLYITLENYAARTEDVLLNINEQVMDTVHEEVELLIGYKINLMSDEMQSVISDVESTVSMFMGNQLEDRLATALINKINEDHQRIYDVNTYEPICLENRRSEEQFSLTTHQYDNSVPKEVMPNGFSDIFRSNLTSGNLLQVNKTLPSNYASDIMDSSNCGSSGEFNYECEFKSEVALSAKQVQHIMKYPNAIKPSIIERYVNIPIGEAINLLVKLNGITKTEVVWTKSSAGMKAVMKNDEVTEVITSMVRNGTTSNLRIWDSKVKDSGLYTAYTNSCPIAVFIVKVIDKGRTPEKPTFRLKMINSSVRSGQSAEFSVEPVGFPKPRLIFYHNNTIINIPSDKYSLDHVPNINRIILKINRVVSSDKGTYKCIASNELGSCECSAELQVISLNFRFEKKIPTYSSGSSIDDDTPLTQIHSRPNFCDNTDNVFGSNASVNQLVEIHEHLAYLEWQLECFEEQTIQGGKSSPTSPTNVDVTSDTVIGRELPDEISYSTDLPVRRVNILPRSQSVTSESSGDVSPNTARLSALKAPIFNTYDTSSNVSRMREIFNQPVLSPPLQRNESLTRRTAPSNVQRKDTQLTKEVRVKQSTSMDH